MLGLIGPNGAGKTTFLNAVSGVEALTSGGVWLGDKDVTGFSPPQLARGGLARTFQNVSSFPALTVAENVEVGALGIGCHRREAKRRGSELLGETGLQHLAHRSASVVSPGDERRLGLARAAAMSPKVLLLDEPAAGLNDHETAELGNTIERLQHVLGCAVLVVDHDMHMIMRVCHRIQVLDAGRTLAEGPPELIRNHPDVIRAYLGEDEPGLDENEGTASA